MPESYFQLTVKNQASAIDAASDASGRAPHLLEKDIWVVWALATLFRSDLGAHLVFKGGTALSKAHKVITRFPNDDECLWTGNVVIEAGSEWEGRGDGAQAVESERLKPRFFLIGRYWEPIGFLRLPEVVDLIGCGGRI